MPPKPPRATCFSTRALVASPGGAARAVNGARAAARRWGKRTALRVCERSRRQPPLNTRSRIAAIAQNSTSSSGPCYEFHGLASPTHGHHSLPAPLERSRRRVRSQLNTERRPARAPSARCRRLCCGSAWGSLLGRNCRM